MIFAFLFAISYKINIRPRIDVVLKEQLKILYSSHINRDYKASRQQMYGHTDCEYDAIRLIYDTEFYPWTCGGDTIPPATAINAEHVVCQSTFDRQRPMVSDLHHLISSPNKLNNIRSNNKFGEFDYSQCNKWCNKNDCNLPAPPDDEKDLYSCLSGGTPKLWLPRVRDRGQIARAVFYFYTIYTDYTISTIGDLDTFKKWNRQYPPDAFEIARNNAINRSQGNRNPFIDDPSLVDQVW